MALDVEINPDHVPGNFLWEIPPECSCGLLTQAFEDGAIFASNFSEEGYNVCYVLIVNKDAELHRADGTPIQFCPWCGDRIRVYKKYPEGH